VATPETAAEADTAPPVAPTTTEGVTRRKKGQAKPFNFRRPNKFNRDHFRAFQIVHETLARQLTTVYSTTLRVVSGVSLVSIEECSYGEFVESSINPSFLAILQISPLPGASLLYMPQPLAMGIIERLLGGPGKGPYPERPLTDIESILMRDLTDRCLREMTYSYESLFEVHAKTMQLESNPQFAQISSPSDMVLLVTFEVKVGDSEGNLQLCIPYASLQGQLENLSGGHLFKDRPNIDSVSLGHALRNRLMDAPVDVNVLFKSVQMRGSEILELQVGDVLPLHHNVNSPLTVKAHGVPHLLAKPGRQGKRLACQIVDAITDPSSNDA
jgi:flagellar motor switch protein FliM